MNRMMTGLALCVLAGTAGFAQAQTYDVGTFRAIEVQDGVRLTVSKAADQMVSAVALDGNVSKLRVREFLPWIVFDRDTRWFIFPKWRDDLLEVSVETPVINGIKVVDNAYATFTGDADARLWVEAGAGGEVNLQDINVVELTLFGTEGGRITADGRCDTLNIRGALAYIDASRLQCGSIVMRVDGSDVILPPDAVLVDQHPELDG